MPFPRIIDSPERMTEVVRRFGIIPFFRGSVPGWSVEEMTAPGCWFDEDVDGESILGPWDWKIEVVREGDIAYGKFLGGKAAFATVEWYRELMNWRRSLPRFRMALGESGFKPGSRADRLMSVLAPVALNAIREAGALEAKELRTICSRTPEFGPVRKNVMDSVMQFLQMGTWSVIGDLKRVYRGPTLKYSGWQLASNTTPDALFAPPSDRSDDAPFWAGFIEGGGSNGGVDPLAVDCSPEESRGRLIARVQEFFPSAGTEVLKKVF